ncbi:MAG: prephenate dehydratase [Terriglobia bacterium]
MKIGYLGPRGTFTEEAVRTVEALKNNEFVPLPTEEDVIRHTDSGRVAKGVIPIENSIEGTVNVTLDGLAFEAGLLIEREIIVAVEHNLLITPGTPVDSIKSIISHPQATAQCRKFLSTNFPRATVEAANSTADAARMAAEAGPAKAAIGTALAAEIYGLAVAKSRIQDYRENRTRFVVVGKDSAEPTGYDKTSLACFIYEDRPGSLLQILTEFADRSINLTKIQSRPTKKSLGDYYFWIDLEGHVSDAQVGEALTALEKKILNVKLLGSYPRGGKRKG